MFRVVLQFLTLRHRARRSPAGTSPPNMSSLRLWASAEKKVGDLFNLIFCLWMTNMFPCISVGADVTSEKQCSCKWRWVRKGRGCAFSCSSSSSSGMGRGGGVKGCSESTNTFLCSLWCIAQLPARCSFGQSSLVPPSCAHRWVKHDR